MLLEPFQRINVCGYEGLAVTRLADHGVTDDIDTIARQLTPFLLRHLNLDTTYKAINTDLQAVNSR